MPTLLGFVLATGLGMGPLQGAPAPGPVAFGADTVPSFSHDVHETLQCTACHQMDAVHGGSLVQSVQDCRSCHHTEQTRMECAACHDGADLRAESYVLPRTFTLTIHERPVERDLSFTHDEHEDVECVSCHAEGPSLSVPDLDCQSCHQEHHEAAAITQCFTCHVEPSEEDHERTVHLTCSGAGCHQEVPVEDPPRSRAGCLTCHRDQTDHRPGRECVACHLMPAPTGRPGAGTGP